MLNIRTILALEPQILADSLRASFVQEPDIEIVHETNDVLDLLLAAREFEPHVVVLSVCGHGRLPPVGTHLLAEFPELLIIGINARSESVFSFRNSLQTEQHSLDNIQQLLTRVRAAALNADHSLNPKRSTPSNDGATGTTRAHR